MPGARGGRIAAVHPGSVGEEIGLEAGDVLVSIDGHPLRDLIDYRFYSAEESLVLVVEREGESHRLEIERDYDEELGLAFDEPVFDGMRQCDNHCPFCFVAQMPKGMRRSLYVRDDDYRYSFLLGNFITLTNLSEDDWQRIGEQHLSPLYVSIHATDLALRRRLLGNPHAEDVLAQLRRLGEMGIRVHGQIVIVPGLNDGEALRCSIGDLVALWPTVQTLALVPVGLTRYHRGGLHTMRPDEAAAALRIAEMEMRPQRKRLQTTWLYPSDELYLLAGAPIPERAFYDDEAQRENGVGLVRSLLDDWEMARKEIPHLRNEVSRITLVCGTLIAPFLRDMAGQLEALTGINVVVIPVANRFFGESVTVSGLLTGKDVLDALSGKALGQRVYLPRAMFESGGELTLDGLTLDEMAARLGAPISLVNTMSDVLKVL